MRLFARRNMMLTVFVNRGRFDCKHRSHRLFHNGQPFHTMMALPLYKDQGLGTRTRAQFHIVVISCQITQWVEPYPLQSCSSLVYGVIVAQQAQISAPTNKQVYALFGWSWNFKFELVEPRLPLNQIWANLKRVAFKIAFLGGWFDTEWPIEVMKQKI